MASKTVIRPILRLSSNECKFRSPLNSFDILTVFLSMWVPHATDVFQTRTNEGEIGLTFNTFRTGIKIRSDETKGSVSLPYNILYMKVPIQIGRQFNAQVRMVRYRFQRNPMQCVLMDDRFSSGVSSCVRLRFREFFASRGREENIYHV